MRQGSQPHAVGHGFERVLINVAQVANGINATFLVRAAAPYVLKQVVARIDNPDGLVVVVSRFGTRLSSALRKNSRASIKSFSSLSMNIESIYEQK